MQVSPHVKNFVFVMVALPVALWGQTTAPKTDPDVKRATGDVMIQHHSRLFDGGIQTFPQSYVFPGSELLSGELNRMRGLSSHPDSNEKPENHDLGSKSVGHDPPDHPNSLCSGWEDAPDVHKECIQAFVEYYKSEIGLLDQRKSTFDFNLMSSRVILAVVVTLVLSGLVFAAIQFWHVLYGVPSAVASAIKARTVADPTKSQITDESQNSLSAEIELSLTDFKVKSSVLGLLIITVSMGFFYLYVRYVYPIQDVTMTQESTGPSNSK